MIVNKVVIYLFFILLIFVSSLTAGPLFVHPENPRYFTDDSVRVVYLTGSHTWLNLTDAVIDGDKYIFDYDQYLDFLEEHNLNFFRLWAWEQSKNVMQLMNEYEFTQLAYKRTGPGLAYDGKPKFDLTKFSEEYFERLYERVRLADERGMYVAIMLFDGFSIGVKDKILGKNPWYGHPFHPLNNINRINGDKNNDHNGDEIHQLYDETVTVLQEAYVRRVIDVVNEFDNVLYEISNESPYGSMEWQYHMIDYIKQYESGKGKQHPVGLTAEWPNGKNEDLYNSNADWISPNGDINNREPADGSKVIIADTDHFCGLCGDRSFAWRSFLAGENPLFMDQYDDGYRFPRSGGYNMNNEKDVSFRKNLGFIKLITDNVNLAKLIPNSELASTEYCLANPGIEYIVYSPDKEVITVDVKSNDSRLLTVVWINPETGKYHHAGQIRASGKTNFYSPFNNDAVLYLNRE